MILAEERTTEEERMHIIEGMVLVSDSTYKCYNLWCNYSTIKSDFNIVTARRRAAAKKKLKNLGKSKSTDTEEEEQDEDCGDDGQLAYPNVQFDLCCFIDNHFSYF